MNGIEPKLNQNCILKRGKTQRSSIVAEMLQKYIFIFNIFLSKKTDTFIFNQIKFFLMYEFCHSNKIHLYSVKIYLCLKIFYIQTDFFSHKNIYSYSIEKNVFNEIFLFTEFW